MMHKVSLHLVSFIFLFFSSVVLFLFSLLFLKSGFGVLVEWEIASLNSCCLNMVMIFDWMSMLFMSFVMFISCLVLFYSGSYMSGDKNMDRFMYLVLGFVTSMMFLIISPNLVSLLLGWDGLGLVSYALVVFYQNEKSCSAGMLTALSNRVGDVGILLSVGLMSAVGGWSFLLEGLESGVGEVKGVVMLVMLAAMTKSAQIPFSAWLPAAMAAPTPVSALVHSSTLVTAGVYLLIRFSPIFNNSFEQSLLLLISSVTMFMAGLGANFETDLKKIIALSTLSQLGVMMFAISMGWPKLAFFHLLTHALFKALLFMCAGSVIHSVGDFQDIRVMGGLVNFMPLSVVSMNLANLALCGTPFLAGFYSKDTILEVAYMSQMNEVIFILLVVSTGMTVCYSFRLVYFTLTGDWNLKSENNVDDNDEVMTGSMSGLIIGSVFMGSVLMWVIFPSPVMICLSAFFKTFTLVVMLVGGVLGYMLNMLSLNYNLKSLAFYSPITFVGSMWFMPFLSTYGVSCFFLKVGVQSQKSGDFGWLEYYGGQGFYSLFMKKMKLLQQAQDNSIKVYMMMVLFWLLMLIMIMN
uniref:NADH-ubiquinone oxidoreductase chain 5 n=1 Tax=Lysmata sp. 1 LQZ-2020 TaxID=2735370 RepID=A0A8X8M153_9EUCA|nr:NADH dehydrogenase subunit 5 [Lysmata sp. 1 LQZ-2020]